MGEGLHLLSVDACPCKPNQTWPIASWFAKARYFSEFGVFLASPATTQKSRHKKSVTLAQYGGLLNSGWVASASRVLCNTWVGGSQSVILSAWYCRAAFDLKPRWFLPSRALSMSIACPPCPFHTSSCGRAWALPQSLTLVLP